MTDLTGVLRPFVDAGALPGAVAAVGRGERIEVVTVGSIDVAGTAPMARDTIVRLASLSKPITAAAVLQLVEAGRLALSDPIDAWLPELAAPVVVRSPSGPVDDVVPANRPITVVDLLTSCAGYGFGSDFGWPAVQALAAVQRDGREPRGYPASDVWLAELARVPLLYQPGAAWLYDTCSTLQGLLIERVYDRSLPDVLAERIFGPLGMTDSGFDVPGAERGRFASYYRATPSGRLELADGPDGQWSTRRRYRPARAGWSRRSTTCSRSGGCCWLRVSARPDAGCCRPSPCG